MMSPEVTWARQARFDPKGAVISVTDGSVASLLSLVSNARLSTGTIKVDPPGDFSPGSKLIVEYDGTELWKGMRTRAISSAACAGRVAVVTDHYPAGGRAAYWNQVADRVLASIQTAVTGIPPRSESSPPRGAGETGKGRRIQVPLNARCAISAEIPKGGRPEMPVRCAALAAPGSGSRWAASRRS